MATITEIHERLALYKKAEVAILEGNQSYRMGNSQFTRADLAQIQSEIRRLESRLAMLQSDGTVTFGQAVFGGRR